MDGSKRTGVWAGVPNGVGAEDENLDRALVAGLMLEVILETAGSPVDPQTRRRLVRTRLKDSLVANLAGRVTLKRFRHLLRQLDQWFPLYYPLVSAGSPKHPAPVGGPGQAPPSPAAPGLSPRRPLREDLLAAWFKEKGRELLPHRPHRKLHQNKLWDFLARTRGGWFRLKDFTRHFEVDRKTGWEYLQKLLATGLLRHNQRHSAAVRYALDTRFLVIRADGLEPKVREALADLPSSLAERVSGWLIATGGGSFWEEDSQTHLAPSWRRPVFTRLMAADILEEVYQLRDKRLLKLAPRWLQE